MSIEYRHLLFIISVLAILVCSCQSKNTLKEPTSLEYATLFDISEDAGGNPIVVSISPYTGDRDTLVVKTPLSRIVCMSSTHVACLSAIGCDSVIVGVSGRNYLSNEKVKERVAEVGYDSALDYETVISLNPQLVVAYSVSDATPAYVSKLRSLGVLVLLVSDQMENHPLARCEYVRLFGALTEKDDEAYEYFCGVRDSYLDIQNKVSSNSSTEKKKVLINTPYSGAWYIPGGENYTAKLISDAGGEILGSAPGQSLSSVISVEEAYVLSSEADVWLHPGSCNTVKELRSSNPLFEKFPVIDKPIYNNTLRTNSEGGNDFWESGAVCPDKILSDLASILNPGLMEKDSLEYYIKVQ